MGKRRLALVRAVGTAWEAVVYSSISEPPTMICGSLAFVERTVGEALSGEFASDEHGSGTWRCEDHSLPVFLDDDGPAGSEIFRGTPKRVD